MKNMLGNPESPIIVPFLKWAGGKRWLTNQYSDLFPIKFKRYIEPFLGSGAVFFHLKPDKALLADCNSELIDTYKTLRSHWQEVQRALQKHHKKHNEDYYYLERARKYQEAHERAAQFIYLNRTCWNGLYRVNLRGEFNVPIGTKQSVVLASDNFEKVASLLNKATLVASDFETTISKAKKDDFIFVDPPYITRHNLNGFVKYNDKIFTWQDQERLHAAISGAAKRGAKILITNAAHSSVRKLYQNIGKQIVLSRHSVLAADTTNRGATTEIAVFINYDIKQK